MKRTTIEFFPAPPFEIDDVVLAKELHALSAVECDITSCIDPRGWNLTVVRDYPDKRPATAAAAKPHKPAGDIADA